MDLTYEKIIEDIQDHNYVEVPFSVPREYVQIAAERFFTFLTLPQEVKETFKVITNSTDRGSNAGYARKEKTKGDRDNKEYFHYRKITREALTRQVPQGINDPRVEEFLQSADRVYTEAVSVLRGIISLIDARYPGTEKKLLSEDASNLLTLRFVKYDPAGQGNFLAAAHYDLGSCTLAIAESAPGLRVGRDDARLKEVVRHGNTAIFMPSLMMNENIGTDVFPPAWHDVVQKSDRVYSPDAARWAIILFADMHKDRVATREETHTPKRHSEY